MKRLLLSLALYLPLLGYSQSPADKVNVFLGSSGDHGQMSPAASYPFSMMSIGAQTYPNLHMGYEHNAKVFLGFTHNRFEGVGCMGSGGNILIKPFVGDAKTAQLIKSSEEAHPGYYKVGFENGINAAFAVVGKAGIEQYSFPRDKNIGFVIDLSHTLANKFINEEHSIVSNEVSGWVSAKTTCDAGTYKIYYHLQFDASVAIHDEGNHLLTVKAEGNRNVTVRIAFSSVDVAHAKADLLNTSLGQAKTNSAAGWNDALGQIQVRGDEERTALFYSLLYRTLQSPHLVSDKDGSYRATNGTVQQTEDSIYNGWAIWDNYRTQLPLLSILYPRKYQQMVNSLVGLYKYGKKDFATDNEPSNTVRTEHAVVVLLDAFRKGYKVDFAGIRDSLMAEMERLDFSHPDKALESSYDCWAMAQIMTITGDKQIADKYLKRAAKWVDYWNGDFKDLSRADVDKIGARGMYQGTVWQYRWLVPFDLKGLMAAAGGTEAYLAQLDTFFDNDYYNHANETDIQVPLMYNVTPQPWRSQELMHKYAVDTVVQYYFNNNSRGVDPFVGVIYRNVPDTYVRTMDDDAGAMSGWFAFSALGFSPACVGWPVYYLNVPLFEEIIIGNGKSSFKIVTRNFSKDSRYIQSATLNGKSLSRNWITHEEIVRGGELIITAGNVPDKTWGVKEQWISDINKQ